ncbi:hypothetical protein TorRG33x02_321720 [Trema orientale]|uniref:Uncharacterized protein n=1 Tax=Trema orientale TaxID=63057 RepID=A0A2P5BGM4_TREOI|nr:hypothetical protein TorRG33x02_321720 [Trema orientale]
MLESSAIAPKNIVKYQPRGLKACVGAPRPLWPTAMLQVGNGLGLLPFHSSYVAHAGSSQSSNTL